jgi:hypothetical protein
VLQLTATLSMLRRAPADWLPLSTCYSGELLDAVCEDYQTRICWCPDVWIGVVGWHARLGGAEPASASVVHKD